MDKCLDGITAYHKQRSSRLYLPSIAATCRCVTCRDVDSSHMTVRSPSPAYARAAEDGEKMATRSHRRIERIDTSYFLRNGTGSCDNCQWADYSQALSFSVCALSDFSHIVLSARETLTPQGSYHKNLPCTCCSLTMFLLLRP